MTNDIAIEAEDAVGNYLHEYGPIVAWSDEWFRGHYEWAVKNGEAPDGQWVEFRDFARAALKRSQSAELARNPSEDESQWRMAARGRGAAMTAASCDMCGGRPYALTCSLRTPRASCLCTQR